MADLDTQDAWLSEAYQPTAAYFKDCDSVEYVNEDTVCSYRRVDEFLTLIFDETGIGLIGFKFKGFGWFYETHLKLLPEFADVRFVDFVKVIEAVCAFLGDELFKDEKRRASYQAVRKIALKEKVTLHDLPLAA